MRNNFFNYILILLVVNSCCIYAKNDEYNEELFIETLPNSHLHFYFQFTTISDHNLNNDDSFKHYSVFPKQFGDIIKKSQINELHLSLTQGLWKHNLWGEPSVSVPPGVELWIWYNDIENKQLIEQQLWSQTTRAFAGLSCASLNFLNNQISVQPKYSYRPQGLLLFNKTNSLKKHDLDKRIKYGSLSNELVCTENLTPWTKLLPCGKHNGLAQLFTSANKLFDTQYHSIGIHFRHVCLNPPTCSEIGVELKQTLSLVIDPEVLMKPQRPIDSYRLSFQSIFSHTLTSTCPVAQKSLVYVDFAHLNTDSKYRLEPKPTETVNANNRVINVFNLNTLFEKENLKQFNLQLNYDKLTQSKLKTSSVRVHRYVTGTTQFSLGFKTVIENKNEKDLKIVYFENIPWYFRVYMNTLKIIDKNNKNEVVKPTSIHYIPALDRVRSAHIEIVFPIKAKTTVELSIKFDNAFLKWTEFPPDAQHGHTINSALVTFKLNDYNEKTYLQYRGYHNYSSIYESFKATQLTNTDRLIKIYAEPLLINLPVPDFSMPYNVICLTCTVIAIGFGSLHNFTTRKFIFTDKNKTMIKKLIAKIKGKFKKSNNKSTNPTETPTTTTTNEATEK